MAAQLRERLDTIDRALARLEAGTYGRSVLSGKPIPDQRLEADPAAELTVEEARAARSRAGRPARQRAATVTGRPRRPVAQAAICARDLKPSLVMMLATCLAAVAGLITSSAAMALLLRPAAMSAAISSSRGVSALGGARRRAARRSRPAREPAPGTAGARSPPDQWPGQWRPPAGARGRVPTAARPRPAPRRSAAAR